MPKVTDEVRMGLVTGAGFLLGMAIPLGALGLLGDAL